MTWLLARLLPVRAYIIGAVLLALLAALGVQTLRLGRAEDKLFDAQLQLQVSEEQQRALGRLIDAQNAGIAAVRAEAEAQQAAALEAAKTASRALARANARAAAIKAAPAPKTCDEAVRFLVDDAARAQ